MPKKPAPSEERLQALETVDIYLGAAWGQRVESEEPTTEGAVDEDPTPGDDDGEEAARP